VRCGYSLSVIGLVAALVGLAYQKLVFAPRM
jgi:hypothetical protein